MKQQVYLQIIQELFLHILKQNSDAFDRYCYNNKDYQIYVDEFFDAVDTEGISVSACEHAHGIGNNNSYRLYLKSMDADGFVIEKNIATFSYVTGIYGGISVYLKDYNTNTIVDSFGHAR